MANIRLIAIDMDGTLVADGKIPRENIRAIRRAQAAGIEVVAATGRMPGSAARNLAPAGLAVDAILSNGALLMDKAGQVLQQSWLDGDAAAGIVRGWQHIKGTFCAVYIEQSMYLFARREAALGFLARYTLASPEAADGFLHETLEGALRALEGGAHKMLISDSGDREGLAAFRRTLEGDGRLMVTSSWVDNIEVMPHGVSKGSGLMAMCCIKGIDAADVLAIGDSENDLAMFKVAGLSAAMGNAAPAVRAQADFVAPSNDQGGVAWAIRHAVWGE
nr:HAD family hydrolase [bacterium]